MFESTHTALPLTSNRTQTPDQRGVIPTELFFWKIWTVFISTWRPEALHPPHQSSVDYKVNNISIDWIKIVESLAKVILHFYNFLPPHYLHHIFSCNNIKWQTILFWSLFLWLSLIDGYCFLPIMLMFSTLLALMIK